MLVRLLCLCAIALAPASAIAAENLALGRPYTLSVPPNYPYCTEEGDATDLTDGVTYAPDPGKSFWTVPSTVGWSYAAARLVEIEIDLGGIFPISGVTLESAAGAADVTFPLSAMVFVSDDSTSYDFAGDVINEAPSQQSYSVHTFRLEGLQAQGRYVRIALVRGGWYLFCDEIQVTGARLADAPEPAVRSLASPDAVTAFATERMPLAHQNGSTLTLVRLAREALAKDGHGQASQAAFARLEAVRRAVAGRDVPERVDYSRGLPYTALDSRVFRAMGEYLEASSVTGLAAWQAAPWEPLGPFDYPWHATPDLVPLRLMRGEWGELAVNVTNCGRVAARCDVRLTPASGSDLRQPAAGAVSVREVVFTEAFGARIRADALVPLRGELRLPPGMTKQLWLTVDSRALLPGKYGLLLSLTPAHGPPVSLPLEFEVVTASMPKEPTLITTHFGYFNRAIPTRFPEQTARNLREHYTNAQCVPPAFMPYPKQRNAAGDITEPMDFSGLDRLIELVPETRLWILWPGFEWDYGNFAPRQGDAVRERTFTQWVNAALDHMQQKGYGPERVAFFWMDEPSQEHMTTIVAPASELLRTIRPDAQVWMDITGDNTPESLAEHASAVDIWCPVENKLDWDFWAGKHTWFYTTASNKAQWPSLHYRWQLWRAFVEHCEGHAFWTYTDDADAWDDYAGTTPTYGVVYMGRDGVVDSKRWEAYRAGIEDYELCTMIRDLWQSVQTHARTLEPQYHEAKAALDLWTMRVVENTDDHNLAERAHSELVGHLQALWELRGR